MSLASVCRHNECLHPICHINRFFVIQGGAIINSKLILIYIITDPDQQKLLTFLLKFGVNIHQKWSFNFISTHDKPKVYVILSNSNVHGGRIISVDGARIRPDVRWQRK